MQIEITHFVAEAEGHHDELFIKTPMAEFFIPATPDVLKAWDEIKGLKEQRRQVAASLMLNNHPREALHTMSQYDRRIDEAQKALIGAAIQTFDDEHGLSE